MARRQGLFGINLGALSLLGSFAFEEHVMLSRPFPGPPPASRSGAGLGDCRARVASEFLRRCLADSAQLRSAALPMTSRGRALIINDRWRPFRPQAFSPRQHRGGPLCFVREGFQPRWATLACLTARIRIGLWAASILLGWCGKRCSLGFIRPKGRFPVGLVTGG